MNTQGLTVPCGDRENVVSVCFSAEHSVVALLVSFIFMCMPPCY